MRSPVFEFLGYGQLPPLFTVLFCSVLVIILVSLASAVHLFVVGARARRRAPAPSQDAADGYLWVALVPALNEEVTIRDSVLRLRDLRAANRLILVIDDGSEDGTAAALAELAGDDLLVLHGTWPQARKGKAAALNAAYAYLDEHVLAPGGRFEGWHRDRVIVAVVDADGRLAPDAPQYVAPHFDEPAVGGVQVAVRIYNRRHPLAWMQDVEFGVYGNLHQLGRTGLGTAGMGGNGQFNRVSALDALAVGAPGPWRDTLTEDQDLGLRLIEAGWTGRQEVRVAVEQQGLSSLRRLLRQRTRWAQGNFQALRHVGTARTAGLSFSARADLLWNLLQPVILLVVGAATVAGLLLAAFGVPFVVDGQALMMLLALLLLAFGPIMLGMLARTRDQSMRTRLASLLTAVPYAFYVWLLWPAVVRAAWRQARGATSWDKTQREPIAPPQALEPVPAG